jgi:hypothetical protein
MKTDARTPADLNSVTSDCVEPYMPSTLWYMWIIFPTRFTLYGSLYGTHNGSHVTHAGSVCWSTIRTVTFIVHQHSHSI